MDNCRIHGVDVIVSRGGALPSWNVRHGVVSGNVGLVGWHLPQNNVCNDPSPNASPSIWIPSLVVASVQLPPPEFSAPVHTWRLPSTTTPPPSLHQLNSNDFTQNETSGQRRRCRLVVPGACHRRPGPVVLVAEGSAASAGREAPRAGVRRDFTW